MRLALLFAFLLAAHPGASAPDATEQAIVAAVDRENERALALVRQSVDINSGTMNFPGVKRVAELFMDEFEELGFTVEWQPGEAFGRAGHVVARRVGNGDSDSDIPRILLVGHLDTVFPADSGFDGYEAIDAHRARGPGITDMKGGNVVMIQALRALREAGALDDLAVTAVLTGDEESSGEPLSLARKALVDAAIWADYAIGFEDGDGKFETVVVARRGSVDWNLEVRGKAAHSSQIFQPEVGYGAVYESARILDAFRERLSAQELLTVNPGVIGGGTNAVDVPETGVNASGKNNVIAEIVRVTGDLRTISPGQLEDARNEMQDIVADSLPHTSATIRFGEGYPPMADSEGNRELLARFDKVSRELGFGAVTAVDPRNAGAADISFAAAHVEGAIDGVGLMGSGGHTVDETADLRTLSQQTKRVAVFLYRLGLQARP
ncbi:MAG TPA: M20/M25/M40 family metallo-hydrolase [Woeseiaceae bacterium]|nr:M20/M25/M40 family metallo-hydrolase [Woeseiaceae bacterium]